MGQERVTTVGMSAITGQLVGIMSTLYMPVVDSKRRLCLDHQSSSTESFLVTSLFAPSGEALVLLENFSIPPE